MHACFACAENLVNEAGHRRRAIAMAWKLAKAAPYHGYIASETIAAACQAYMFSIEAKNDYVVLRWHTVQNDIVKRVTVCDLRNSQRLVENWKRKHT